MKNSDNDNSDTLIEDLLGATHLTMSGVKEDSDLALKKEVGRLVSAATILGGLSLGMICVFSDVVGVIGGAHGILVLSSILYSLSEQWKKENAPIQLLG
jgi:preprotein translocase subunit SecY